MTEAPKARLQSDTIEGAAYARSVDWLIDALAVDPETGLTEADVSARRREFGSNVIGTATRTSYWRIALNQLRGAVVWLLFGAIALSAWLGDIAEVIAITAVLIVNSLIGFVTEARAAKSMDALRKLTHSHARVRRNGSEFHVDAEELVPGDIVLLEAGDVVPADLRLILANDLNADESALTGESLPVEKSPEAIGITVPLADRRNMVFRGTSITRGTAIGITTATGVRTQLGEISEMVAGAEAEVTPLERRLDQLGRHLAIAALVVSAAIAVLGFATGRPLFDMLEIGIALAVAAVPEGLPIVATLALARGMWRMAARNALINRLSAVETLGSANVLLTDKTGTLTENRMAVARLDFADAGIVLEAERNGATLPQLDAAVMTMILCNDAVLGDQPEDTYGDPMEVALLRAALDLGQNPEACRQEHGRQATVAFDTDTKMMATVNSAGDETQVFVKGAPEAVLAASSALLTRAGRIPMTPELRRDLHAKVESGGARGLRMLGLAVRDAPFDIAAIYDDLTLVGFAGLRDPARPDVLQAIENCHRAGVRVVMVTGDHKATARRIAQDVHLVSEGEIRVSEGNELAHWTGDDALPDALLQTDVFARVQPREKLVLVSLHQKNGAVVAMTGDGVNDAPALRKADIGIAMGKRGTQVAAEASDVILRDDAFGSIVEAMRQGRIIYGNIRTFIRYLFTCNLSEILLVGLATFCGLPMPLTALQILFLNLITDVFPAIALGFGEGSGDVMREPPRRKDEPLITRRTWSGIVVEGSLLGLCSLGVFIHELGRVGNEAATGAAFLTICIAQLLFVFAMYRKGESVFSSEVTRNRYVWIAVIFSTAVMLSGVFVQPLAEVLRIVPPDAVGWAVISGSAALSTVLVLVMRAVIRI